jgi:hypothetical protein
MEDGMDAQEFLSRLAAGERAFDKVELADIVLLSADLRHVHLRQAA